VGYAGEAMSMGERSPIAALTPGYLGAWPWQRPSPIFWLHPSTLDKVKLSANWMAACGEVGEDAALV
jgi:phosphoribosylformylglycinamidine synthase